MKIKLFLLYIILSINTLLANSQSTIFTQEELKYLKNKKELRMCTMSTLEPFEQIIDGKHEGVIANVMNLFKEQLPIPIKLIEAKSNKEISKLVKDKKCDFKPSVLKEFNVIENTLQSNPYISDNFVIITSLNRPYIEDINNLKNKTFAVPYISFKNYLTKYYPDVNVIYLSKQKQIIKKLKTGEIYGYINISIVANHEINKFGFENLKVNSKLDSVLHGSVGVSNQDTILLQIFNKIIENTSAQKIEDIKLKKRIYIYQNKTDYKVVFMVTLIFLIILGIILYFLFKQIRLKKEIQKQSLLLINQSNNAAIGRLMSMIAHQWRQPLSLINGIVSKTYFDTSNKELLKIEDITHDLSQTISKINKFYAYNKNRQSKYIKDIVDECVDILFPVVATSLKPEIIIKEDDALELQGYSSGLQQTIITLLSNSLDIFNQRDIKNPTITIRLYKQSDFNCIDIEDNGGGIDKSNIDKIFNTNFSTNNQLKYSRGYGLSIAKDIIENNLNGTIKVLNTKDGAKFTIRYK